MSPKTGSVAHLPPGEGGAEETKLDCSPAATNRATVNPSGDPGPFEVHTKEYTGPFDLLADLVAKRKLDITAFALAEVTQDFLAYLSLVPDLAQASQFLVIGATLLDIKAARLLPSGSTDLEEDLELLEARDLLISRLLQYKTFKEVSILLGQALAQNEGYLPHSPGNDPLLAAALPKITTAIDPQRLAAAAAQAFFSAPPEVIVTHLHDPLVPVATQVKVLANRLRRHPRLTFAQLISDASSTAEVISRFLAVLDMFRFGAVELEQTQALGELTIIAKDLDKQVAVGDYDQGPTFKAQSKEDDTGGSEPNS